MTKPVTNPILFTPGPVRVPSVVANALSNPPCNYHRQDRFRELFQRTETALKTFVGIRNPNTYFATRLTCTGTGANEACLVALAATGKGIIVSNGFFGERILDQAKTNGINHIALRMDHAQPIDIATLTQALDHHSDLAWIFFVSHETRTGLKNPLVAVGTLAKQHNLLVAADIVSSAFAYPVDIEAAHLDLAIASSAKALMAVPGIGIVFVKQASVERLSEHKRKSYYLDPIAELHRQSSSFEPRFAQPVVLYAALAAACDYLESVGIDNHMHRIQHQMADLTQHLENLGVPAMLQSDFRSGVATNFRLPKHLPYSEFAAKMETAGYFLLYGIPGDSTHFQLSTIGDLHDEHIDGIKHAFTNVLE